MYYVVWYEPYEDGEIRQESGGFNSLEAADRWMNNNLDSSIKHAYICYRG